MHAFTVCTTVLMLLLQAVSPPAVVAAGAHRALVEPGRSCCGTSTCDSCCCSAALSRAAHSPAECRTASEGLPQTSVVCLCRVQPAPALPEAPRRPVEQTAWQVLLSAPGTAFHVAAVDCIGGSHQRFRPPGFPTAGVQAQLCVWLT